MYLKKYSCLQMALFEVIGISGKISSGKDHVAQHILSYLLPPKRTVIFGFADFLKLECVAKDNIEYDRVFVKKDKESRNLLQKRGTEEGRDKYGVDIWLRVAESYMKLHHSRGVERFIIVDVRFPNEVECVKKLGGMVIRLVAPKRTWKRALQESEGNVELANAIMNHASEISLDHYTAFDHVIPNDPEDALTIVDYIRSNIVPSFVKRSACTIIIDLDDTLVFCNKYYDAVVEQVVKMIHTIYETKYGKFPILDSLIERVINERIETYYLRYYQRDGFAKDLLFLVQNVLPKEDCTSELLDKVYQMGLSVYSQPYDPIGDSLKVVDEIAKLGQVVIYTLGDRVEQTRKLVRLGLTKYHNVVYEHKNADMFRHLKSKYLADKYIVIGDSISRDCTPAREAGIGSVIHITKELPLTSPKVMETIKQYVNS